MTSSTYLVEHVRFVSAKSFDQVRADFERQLGRLDPKPYERALARGDRDAAKAVLEAMAGSSGFMVFATQDHGALLAHRATAQRAPVHPR
jgi:hypothetical protein